MTQDLTPEAVAKMLRENCSCNIDTAPCGAEDECRNAFIAADMLEALSAKLAEVEVELDYTHGTNDLLRGITEAAEALATKLTEVERERDRAWIVAYDATNRGILAEAEVARLRDALQDAVHAWDNHNKSGDMMQGYWVDDARAALQPKETDHE
jgi:hypothetical protein